MTPVKTSKLSISELIANYISVSKLSPIIRDYVGLIENYFTKRSKAYLLGFPKQKASFSEAFSTALT